MLINQSDHVQLVTFVLGKDWLKQIILNHYFHFCLITSREIIFISLPFFSSKPSTKLRNHSSHKFSHKAKRPINKRKSQRMKQPKFHHQQMNKQNKTKPGSSHSPNQPVQINLMHQELHP